MMHPAVIDTQRLATRAAAFAAAVIALASAVLAPAQDELLAPHGGSPLNRVVNGFPEFAHYTLTVDNVQVVRLDDLHVNEYVVGGGFENRDPDRRRGDAVEPLNSAYGSILIFLSKAPGAESESFVLDDYIEFPGDRPPQSLAFIDIDRDGRKDLVVLAGLDEIATTSVYHNETRAAPTADGARPRLFRRVFYDPQHYATLLDLGEDKRPELLVPIGVPPSGPPGSHGPCAARKLSGELRAAVQEDYDRLGGEWLGYHARHGDRDRDDRGYLLATNAMANLFVFDRFQIFGWDGGAFVERTARYTAFLERRRQLLELALRDAGVDAACSGHIETLRTWLAALR